MSATLDGPGPEPPRPTDPLHQEGPTQSHQRAHPISRRHLAATLGIVCVARGAGRTARPPARPGDRRERARAGWRSSARAGSMQADDKDDEGDGARLVTRGPAVALPRGVILALLLATPMLTAPVAAAQVVTTPSGATAADSGRAAHSAPTTAAPAGALRIGRTGSEAIRLDGRLDESAWATVDSIADFRQREPANGAPATERTVVRVLASPEALYVGVHAFDAVPRSVRATQLRRDADLTVDDYVTLLVDSFRDRRGAFLFRTNPNGARWDAQLVGFEDPDENWNGIWDVATRRDSTGWTAEFRLPFRTLRYHPGETAFGFNVQRFIRRKNEEALWRSWGRTQGLIQLLEEGTLTGVGPLQRGHDLELRPYVLGRTSLAERGVDGRVATPADVAAKAGLDAKLAVSPTLTADFTVNTDFAQVEVDQQVINLTRFPLFFPEKREFFLESGGLFNFGTPERAQVFYSRRVGLRDGMPVPILAGARLYGKVGPWALGVLDARTGEGEEANDLVVRVEHDLLQRSHIGGIATLRSGPGVAGTEAAAGLDIDLPLVVGGRNLEPSFWIAGTHLPGVRGTPTAWRFGTDYPNDLFDNFVSLYRIADGFTPTLGFVRRTGIWETTGHIDFTPRPHVLGIRQLDIVFPIPSWDIIANGEGSLFRSRDWQTAELEWRLLGGVLENGGAFEANLQRFLDAPTDSFPIFRDVTLTPGRYWWTRGELQYATSPGRPLSLSSLVSIGDFYAGTSTELEFGATWRPRGKLILGADIGRSAIRLPEGRFTTVQATTRVEYAFNTHTTLQTFVQYNNDDQRVDVNLRFHWIPTIGDDIYLVWNSGYSTDPAARFRFPHLGALGQPLDGALILKAVHRLAR